MMWPLLLILVAGGAGVAYWKWGRHPAAPAPLPPRVVSDDHPLLTIIPTDPHGIVNIVEPDPDPDWVVVLTSLFFEHPDIRTETIRSAHVGEFLYTATMYPPVQGWVQVMLDYGVVGWIGEQYVKPFNKTRAVGATAMYPGGMGG
jgi:hypothetical protein